MSARENEEAFSRALRAAYEHLDPQPPGGPLEEASPEVRAAVDWMRAAWRRLEAPPSSPSAARRRKPSGLSGRRHRAAAAILLALVLAGLWALGGPSERSDHRVSRDPPPVSSDGGSAGQADVRTKVIVASEERLEVRRGCVTLVLVPREQGTRDS